jgi:hypothetical protein
VQARKHGILEITKRLNLLGIQEGRKIFVDACFQIIFERVVDCK